MIDIAAECMSTFTSRWIYIFMLYCPMQLLTH